MKYLAIQNIKKDNGETINIRICNKKEMEMLKEVGYEIIKIEENTSTNITIGAPWLHWTNEQYEIF